MSTLRPESSSGRSHGGRSTTPGSWVGDPERGRNARATSRRSPTTEGGTCSTSSPALAAHPRPGRRPSDLDVGQGAFGSRRISLCPRADYTGAAWSPTDDKLYVGKGEEMRWFNYATGAASAPFSVAGVRGILGMEFGPAGANLFVTVNSERLIRIDWATRTVVSGWTFDLTPFGVRDSRAVAVIGNQFFVSDGYDSRPKGDPLRHAVFVLGVTP